MFESILQMVTRSVRKRQISPPVEQKLDQHWAVIVGIDDYAGGFNALENARCDALALAGLLQSDYEYELWPAGEPLLDRAAGLQAIQAAVSASLNGASGATSWLFYFAGHGTVIDNRGYLLPADAQQDGLPTYLPVNWLLNACLESPAAATLIILDACYSGSALVRPDDLSDLIPKKALDSQIRQIITSGNPDQPVLDGGGSGHSIFSQLLLEVLGGWAGIHEQNGAIRFTTLLDYLASAVSRRLGDMQHSPGRQQPLGGNLVGNRLHREFILKPVAPRLPPATVQGVHSADPEGRRASLAKLIDDSHAQPEVRPLAVHLALMSLRAGLDESNAARPAPASNPDPVVVVRAEAAVTLGELGDPAALEPLIQSLTDAAEVRRAAAGALARLADRRAVPALLAALRASDEAQFIDLAGAIGSLGDFEAIVETLRESLRRDQLVPFIGPDLPQALTALPERAALAHELAQREGLAPGSSLAQAAADTMRGGSRFAFTDFLRGRLNDPRLRPAAFHQDLAQLGAPFWINGCYDRLLGDALRANFIVSGGDVAYLRQDRPTVVQLMGEVSRPHDLIVLEEDYDRLRSDETDRIALVSFLRQHIRNQVILFLGYDPASPDFELINRYILNRRLAGVNAQAFLAWPGEGARIFWDNRPIFYISGAAQEILAELAKERLTG